MYYYKTMDGSTHVGVAGSAAIDVEGVCDFCGGQHDKVCRDEWAFVRQVREADVRLHGAPPSWRRAQRSVGGKAAADYRDRGKEMAV